MLNKHDRGNSMILVLLVVFVLSVLGATFLTIALAETNQVSFQEKKMQAYYIARSGVESVAEDIINNPNDTFRNSIERNPSRIYRSAGTPLGEGSFDATVTIENNSIVIEAIGTVPNGTGSVSAKAKLRLYNLHNRAIFAVNSFDLRNLSELRGEVESTHGVISNVPQHVWHEPRGKYENTGVILPGVSVPSLPNYNSGAAGPVPHDFAVPNNTTLNLPGSFVYSNVTVGNGGTIVFNTTGGDIKLVVKNLMDIRGGFEIIGTNNVFIFLATPSTVTNEIKTSDSAVNLSRQLFVFLSDGVNLQIKTGGRDFFGHIYGPKATVTIGSNAEIRGSITGNIFAAAGNPSVFHEPLLVTPAGFPSFTNAESRYRIGVWE